MPVVSSSMHLVATPLLYTQFGMVSRCMAGHAKIWQGFVPGPAIFAPKIVFTLDTSFVLHLPLLR
jgi:hypothetical protein